MASRPEGIPEHLEAAILERPDDPAAYEALAVVLERSGQPVGSLPVGVHPDVRLTWRNGFVSSVDIGTSEQVEEAARTFTQVWSLPVFRYVRRVSVSCRTKLHLLLDILREGEPHPLVQELELVAWRPGSRMFGRPPIGDLSGFYEVFPALRTLRVTGQRIGLGCPNLPELTQYVVLASDLSPGDLDGWEHAHLPSLEVLDLSFGPREVPIAEVMSSDGDVEAAATAHAVRMTEILSPERMPRLKHLVLSSGWFGDALLAALAEAPILSQLSILELPALNITDDGVGPFLEQSARWTHLERLALGANFLSEAVAARVAEAVPVADLGRQYDPERFMDPEMYEGMPPF